jgi:hypothetical protein
VVYNGSAVLLTKIDLSKGTFKKILRCVRIGMVRHSKNCLVPTKVLFNKFFTVLFFAFIKERKKITQKSKNSTFSLWRQRLIKIRIRVDPHWRDSLGPDPHCGVIMNPDPDPY